MKRIIMTSGAFELKKLDILFVDWGLSNKNIEQALSDELSLEILNFTQVLRTEIQDNGKFSHEINGILNSGKTLNEEIIGRIITNKLSEKSDDLLLTEYPRLDSQFVELQKILGKQDFTINKIWFFKLRNEKEFMKQHFSLPINKKYLEKYGDEIIRNWVSRFEEKRKNIDHMRMLSDSLEWQIIEMDYMAEVTVEYIKEQIRNCA